MKRHISLLLSLLLLISVVVRDQRAQSTSIVGDAGATDKADKAQLYQAILDLTNSWTVMCVAAHPDDEDGSTLTVLRRKYGAHTVSLFSTYGEGGQNAVGPELYEDLGVIRARETMAAASVQGSEAYFLGLKDFGFSKSAEEAFRVWGEKEALRRMVLKIRELRPDVIITNHNTTSGHGHHQATGRLILQAFDAAADPKQFPEQLSHVTTWQPQRLFVRASREADTNARPSPAAPLQVVTIDPNEVDPIRGISYAQQALSALHQHASQGPWPKAISPNGARIIRYNLVRQLPSAGPLPADAKTVLDGLRLPETISPRFKTPTIDNKPLTDFVDNRGEVLVSLINARKRGAFTATKEIEEIDAPRFHLMAQRLDTALAAAAGAQLTIKSEEKTLVPGAKAQFEVSVSNAGDTEIAIKSLRSRGLPLERQLDPADKLLPGTDTSQQVTAVVPKSVRFSLPSAEHLYDGRLFGEPLIVDAGLEIEGARFSLTAEKRTDVGPPVEIANNNPSPCVETPATLGSCLTTSVTLSNNLNRSFRGELLLTAGFVGQLTESSSSVTLEPHEQRKLVLGTAKAAHSSQTSRARLTAAPTLLTLRDGVTKDIVTRSVIPVVYVPGVALAGLRVGYLPSTDETLKHSLAALGVQAEELQVKDVKDRSLTSFDTIIIDNRGYEAHPELIAVNDRLLKFVEEGGTLLVFYHKTNEWNPDERAKRPQLAPYPITLNDDRVTEEDAAIQLLDPRHPLLNFPNRITQRDFAGWIQERGLYFPKEWDPHFTALLSTHDKDESPLKGGLLVARYGKGNYIYTSMVWYRQLRAGNPGGYRFFANLISYGHQGMPSRLPGTPTQSLKN